MVQQLTVSGKHFDRDLGLDLRALTPDTLGLLERFSRLENVRELQSVLKQAMLQASGHVALPEFLPDVLHHQDSELAATACNETESLDVTGLIDALLLDKGRTGIYDEVMEAVERVLFKKVLRQTNGHQAQASQLLGLNRTTLRYKLRLLGLALDKTVQDMHRKKM